MRGSALEEIAVAEIAGLGVVKHFCDRDGPHLSVVAGAPLCYQRPDYFCVAWLQKGAAHGGAN
jgi:hypothetical protein